MNEVVKVLSTLKKLARQHNKMIYLVCAVVVVAIVIYLYRSREAFTTTMAQVSVKTPIPIVVIANTSNQDYIDFINKYWIPLLLWLEKHRSPELNVYIYLIFGSGNSFEQVNIPPEISKFFIIYEDIPETYTPGILQKTIRAFEDMKIKHPDYEILYRTNLSTFLVLDRIVKRVHAVITEYGKQNIYMGKTWTGLQKYENIDIDPSIVYVSGIDIMLSKDVVDFLIHSKDRLDYGVIDDLEIGRILHLNNNIVKSYEEEHILWDCMNEGLTTGDYLTEISNKLDANPKLMVVRLKCADGTGSRSQDTLVMQHLLPKYYQADI